MSKKIIYLVILSALHGGLLVAANAAGAKLIAVTSNKKSRLSQLADISIMLSATCNDKERAGLAPLGTLFEASAWIFLDSIVADLMELKGETEEKMRQRHATLEQ